MAGDRPASKGRLPETLQTRRHANLRRLLVELESDDIESNLLVDQVLGLRTGVLASLRKGADMPDALAREIEWAMNRAPGWLDRNPKEPEV
ncbi:hypothetical protein L2Y96_12810 [Luteibacter aegosomaticola]|uniref:hypothetical protein n=1 Tax=Luteibacter aegosomaticola TaxID=2911538 RepID=UPI001FF809C0|nr:hypothetical protein [Luteibacter aegosomaticola]UPG88301.1 hypothetical protein L2Y96_12810 [Luteibacter aegosomaticola]